MKKVSKVWGLFVVVVLLSFLGIRINAEASFNYCLPNYSVTNRCENSIIVTEYDFSDYEFMPRLADYCPDDDAYETVNGYFGVHGQSSTNNQVRNMSGGLSGSKNFFYWITGNHGLNLTDIVVIKYNSVTLTWRGTSNSDGTPVVDINPLKSTYPY